MKKILTTLTVILITTSFFAQIPDKISYQAIVRDINNDLISNQSIGMKISILQSSIDGTTVYEETQTPTTNVNGMISIEIGNGEIVSGDFTKINWADGTYFIKTEVDPTGGTNYTISGTTQLLSVPYSLHSKTVKSFNVYSSQQVINLNPEIGDVVFNSTDNICLIFNGEKWISFNSECWPQPTKANAGPDQSFNNGTVSASLSANEPIKDHGVGKWEIVKGTGGHIDDVNSPNTIFTGELHGVYTLTWTITTNCDESIDTVMIAFNQDGTGPQLTDIDGNTYNTVYIGRQLWMAEDLRVTHYPNGNAIPTVSDTDNDGNTDNEWANLGDNNTDDAYCFYYDDSNTDYGALYNYAAAIGDNWMNDNVDGQGVCPDGWHLPSDAEWQELVDYLGGQSVAGGKLKETGTVHWNSPNEGATNESGFTALPGGLRRYYNGMFENIKSSGYWISSTEYENSGVYYRQISSDESYVFRDSEYKSQGYSVRCIKDY